MIYFVLHDYFMVSFCQVKEGTLLDDIGTQVSNLATKVTEGHVAVSHIYFTYIC